MMHGPINIRLGMDIYTDEISILEEKYGKIFESDIYIYNG